MSSMLNIVRRITILFPIPLLFAFAGTLSFSQDNTANKTPQPETFNGYQHYRGAFLALTDLALPLVDESEREKWAAEWEWKHANDGVLSTEEGADNAVQEMVESLGQRFDRYLVPAQKAADHAAGDPVGVGVGLALQLMGGAQLMRLVPDNATEEQEREIVKITKEHPLQVNYVVDGSPAERVGIQSGDRLLEVNSHCIDGLWPPDAMAMIGGQENTTVAVTMERTEGDGSIKELTFSMTREKLVYKVVSFKELGNGVSYVKLRNFESQYALDEMKDALKKAAKGKALIIDLRDNGGGSFVLAVAITQLVLPEGTIFVRVERDGDRMVESRGIAQADHLIGSDPDDNGGTAAIWRVGDREELLIEPEMPVIILVNDGTASASELLAGALWVNHKATLVGTPTVGKGVGQVRAELPFDRELHITNFEFYPGGMSIDWVGLIPDVEIEQFEGAPADVQLEVARSVAEKKAAEMERFEARREELRKKHLSEFKQSRNRK